MQPPSKDYELPEGAVKTAASAADTRASLSAAPSSEELAEVALERVLDRYVTLGFDLVEVDVALTVLSKIRLDGPLGKARVAPFDSFRSKLQQTLEALQKAEDG